MGTAISSGLLLFCLYFFWKEYHCSYWEEDIKYNVSIQIPGKNPAKYKISDDKRCQDQEYGAIFDGLTPGQIYEISVRTIYKNRISSVASNQFTTL